MKRDHHKQSGSDRKRARKRLPAVAAGAAAMLGSELCMDDALAAPIHKLGPLSITINGPDVEWDVDGDGSPEFLLQTSATTSAYSGIQYSYRYVMVNSYGLNGRGFVNATPATPTRPPGQSEDVQNLAPGLPVGPTLPSGHFWGFTDVSYRTLISTYRSGDVRDVYLGAAAIDFVDGVDGFAGFRFEIGDELHYGWARLNIDLDAVAVTIVDWVYESAPGEAVAVGVVPEPAAGGLALLAAGAAGVARRRGWRQTKQRSAT